MSNFLKWVTSGVGSGWVGSDRVKSESTFENRVKLAIFSYIFVVSWCDYSYFF